MKQPLDHLKSQKKPNRQTVYLSGEPEVESELEELQERLKVVSRRVERATLRGDEPSADDAEEVSRLEDRISDLKELSKANAMKFVMVSIGRKRYSALIDEHPATAEQKAESQGDQSLGEVPFNPDTFPLALIAHSIENVEGSVEDIIAWLEGDEWNNAEIAHLFNVAVGLNVTRRLVEMGKD